MEKFQCPCCGSFELDSDDEYEVCPVCFWERDRVQENDPGYAGGANKMSLSEARENYVQYGACSEELVPFVRPPFDEEYHGNNESLSKSV